MALALSMSRIVNFMIKRAMATTSVPIYTVDAFTSKLFTGNPAAVCPLDKDISDEVKQKIAIELNLSETAFLTKLNPDDSFENSSDFKLRWFTPKIEIRLCGHATLSTAAVLFNIYKNKATQLHFQTLSGVLVAQRQGEFISLDMPLNQPQKVDQQQHQRFNSLISVVTGKLTYDDVQYNSHTKKLLICLSDTLTRSDLENINPSFPSMLNDQDTEGQVNGVIVTLGGPNAKPYDFVSRYFAPWCGVNEDPVTGAAHTVLAGYWSKKLDKVELKAFQCSKRGGELLLTVQENSRVMMKGNAKIVIQGTINLQ